MALGRGFSDDLKNFILHYEKNASLTPKKTSSALGSSRFLQSFQRWHNQEADKASAAWLRERGPVWCPQQEDHGLAAEYCKVSILQTVGGLCRRVPSSTEYKFQGVEPECEACAIPEQSHATIQKIERAKLVQLDTSS